MDYKALYEASQEENKKLKQENKKIRSASLKSVSKLNKKIKDLTKEVEEMKMKLDATRQVAMCYAKTVGELQSQEREVDKLLKGLIIPCH